MTNWDDYWAFARPAVDHADAAGGFANDERTAAAHAAVAQAQATLALTEAVRQLATAVEHHSSR